MSGCWMGRMRPISTSSRSTISSTSSEWPLRTESRTPGCPAWKRCSMAGST